VKWVLLFFFFLSLSGAVSGQAKSLTAIRVSTSPKIDGLLSDSIWHSSPPISGFVQSFPSFGVPSSTKSEVRILYDDAAVYVSAYLFDDPAQLGKQLTARDDEQRKDVDYFSVFFDTYNDQQNGFQFLVTTNNVQSDGKLAGSSLEEVDKTWDAVWQSRVSYRPDGWIVEMRIPYISLRFSKNEIQTWGLQLLRFTRRNNELAYWNPVDPKVAGFVNQFGKLEGLKNIQPPLRLSFAPYLATGVRFNPAGHVRPTESLTSGGMDVKYGINESFTLDATLIPDFGQVISDDIVNNLSPFEQRFQENRPFFTEGTELFNKSGLFYSRRVGAVPSGYNRVQSLYSAPASNYIIKRNPAVTKLYNAIKLSGRTKSKLGIGVFNAVTKPMYAQLVHKASKLDSTIQTEALTNYNIVVIDKAFKGRSSLTFTNTNVTRNGAEPDANVTALDWALFSSKSTYAITGTARYAKTFGYRTYRNSYFLNTDTTTINNRRYLNPYDGYSTRLRFSKVGGKVRFGVGVNIESDKYDPNDLGFIQTPNTVVYSGTLSYNQLEPTDKFIRYTYSFNVRQEHLFKPYAFSQIELNARSTWVFKNFWDVTLFAGGQPVWQTNYFELQTKGFAVRKPWFYFTGFNGSTDSRKRLFSGYEFVFADGEFKNSKFYKTEASLRYRFSNKLTADINIDRQHDKLQVGWSFLRELNRAPIVGYRDYKEISSVLSGTYNFTSRANIAVRARHYWSTVTYLRFFNVDNKGNHIPRAFIPNQDQNFNLFNMDAFFTWDFRYGSRIIAGWKNFLGNEFLDGLEGASHASYTRNLGGVFNLPHGNELSLRIIYFLDYNTLRKRL